MKTRDGFGHEKPNEGETNDWITPKWIIDGFNNYSTNGEMFFDLDPCSSLDQPWPTAKSKYTIEQNGLLSKWHGKVYCNSPYGSNVGAWSRKMAEHNNGIMLIFARIETQIWFDGGIFDTASGFAVPKGRIAFYEFECVCGFSRSAHLNKKKKIDCENFVNTGNPVRGHEAGAPSVFVSWGKDMRETLIQIAKGGMIDDRGVYRKFAFLPRAIL